MHWERWRGEHQGSDLLGARKAGYGHLCLGLWWWASQRVDTPC